MGGVWLAWVAALLICIIIAAVAGAALNGTIWGLFIDRRNSWSLSQLQIGLWTLTILPVIVAIVVGRATDDPNSAWDISIPGEVLAVMAISLGSTASALVVKSQKDRPEGANALAAGQRIPTRASAKEARFVDILSYDEGKFGLRGLDVTKYQNLIFTIALVAVYLWNALWMFGKATSPDELTGLPTFNETAVAILGVSHAGYLVGKVVPQPGDPPTTDQAGNQLAPAAE